MLPVFYRPEQSCDEAVGYSPSAGKPALVMKDWLSNSDIAVQIEVKSFEPATRDVLCGAHDSAYVDGVLDCTIANGFGEISPAIAQSLAYTSGSLLAAAKHVLSSVPFEDGAFNVAVSPTSGFHHAAYDHGGGYCTFNGLVATAVEVHRLGLAERILILDFDQHFGDGTEDIINRLGLDYITHVTAKKSYRTTAECLERTRILENHLVCGTCMDKKYDLIIFQAGADIHVNDPLGGLLSTQQMLERDTNIFRGARLRNVPLVWNLAGGYQRDELGGIEPVLKLHRQTMEQCLRVGGGI